jgi:hypothetical protein
MQSASKSFLVIAPDTAALLNYASREVKKFDPVDVFWLKSGNLLEPQPLVSLGKKKASSTPATDSIQVKETCEFMGRAHLAAVGRGKLMVICDMAKMTPQAQNKMLKTIEDAVFDTTFLLLSTSGEEILNTIKSRCMTIYLPRVSGGTLAEILPAGVLETVQKIFGTQIDEKTLNPRDKYAILNAVSDYNRAVAAKCNENNQKDLIIMEILKCVKR